MLSASSPITFPKSSSPPAPKRAKPHDDEHSKPKPKPRAKGPFVDDDESDESDESDDEADSRPVPEHVAKRPMLHDPREPNPAAVNGEADSSTAVSGSNTHRALSDRSIWLSQRPLFTSSALSSIAPTAYTVQTCNGRAMTIKERKPTVAATYESMVAARSKTKEGRAKRSYYGIEIHELINAAYAEMATKNNARPNEPNGPVQSVETEVSTGKTPKKTLLWTEKYRARKFGDLCGNGDTDRLVLGWLKRWDPIVFPGAARSKPVMARRLAMKKSGEEKPHRKILMLTGPPGLGKTTLAHVCARQAGYDIMEINASDDRSRDVVKNRIRTSLGTESVKTVSNRKQENGPQKAAKPVCVVVDEVDGVVSGSGGTGEGGFVKALIDLVLLDQKNAPGAASGGYRGHKKKGDDFRLMRPLILICNDVYHPSLRPLRQSNLAEIIHVGKPPINAVVDRLKKVFENEGIPCEKDAAHKLCEAAWGLPSGLDAKKGVESTVQGDLRGVMVVGEWVAGLFRSSSLEGNARLTKRWIENNVLQDLANGAGGARGLGRGSVKDIVSRLFQLGGGFPTQAMDLSKSTKNHELPQTELGWGEYQKKYAVDRLTQMIETSGEIGYILTEVFAEYPNRMFQDDMYLSKPNQAYDWLHFHDQCQSRLYSSQVWELAPYLAQPVLACHGLFASPTRHVAFRGSHKGRGGDADDDDEPPLPFSGPRADYEAHEAEKQNRAELQAMQSQLPPTLMRSFRSAEDIAIEFLPYLVRIVSPDVKPVVVGGSQGSTAAVRKEGEWAMVKRASEVLADVGIELHKGKIESESFANRGTQYVYRMDPDLDALATFETRSALLSSQAPTRYAVRQVLDQELQRTKALRETLARKARFQAGNPQDQALFEDKEKKAAAKKAQIVADAKNATLIKKDFFGRVIEATPLADLDGNSAQNRAKREQEERKAWVTYHEGLNNAVRKPLSLQEFLKGM